MKFQNSEFNPLSKILELFEDDSDYLTLELLQTFTTLLNYGGVACESTEEAIQCIAELEQLGLLKVTEVVTDNKTLFKVKSNYGK
jgi:hypothetical protein